MTAPNEYASVRYLVDDVQAAVDFYTTHLAFTVNTQAPAFADVVRRPLPLLLEQGRAKEACAAFEAAQVLAPGRGHSLLGLSKCARQLGNTEVADNAEARLAKVRLREALASYITSGTR